MIVLRLVALALGLTLVLRTLLSAIRTFVLPRGAVDTESRLVFRAVRLVLRPWAASHRTYAQRDSAMALYAPVSLLTLLVTWLALILAGYTAIFWALGVASWQRAFSASGSSLFTLGFEPGENLLTTAASFSEAAIGLIMVALLIAYLPTMYAAFSRREAAVTMLEVRAGSPPSAVEMLLRYQRLGRLDHLTEVWATWEAWFADVEETHTSLAALAFFRSPQPEHSWVTAAGAVLDAASLTASTLNVSPDPQINLCIRAGYICLRRVADFFGIEYDPAPSAGDPIHVSPEEFFTVRQQLVDAGLPMNSDQEQAWRDFQGWRVNYDTVLLALAHLVMAPEAPWSSDRRL